MCHVLLFRKHAETLYNQYLKYSVSFWGKTCKCYFAVTFNKKKIIFLLLDKGPLDCDPIKKSYIKINYNNIKAMFSKFQCFTITAYCPCMQYKHNYEL